MKYYLVKYKDDWNKTRTYGIYTTEDQAREICWQVIERDLYISIVENRKEVGIIYNQSWSAVWYSNLDYALGTEN